MLSVWQQLLPRACHHWHSSGHGRSRLIDSGFAGSIPQLYDTYLVPLIFEPYAADLAQRLAREIGRRACSRSRPARASSRGRWRRRCPTSVSIVATDLNQAMLDRAAAVGTARAVEWRQADAMQLPFPDGAFDAVVCQFGAMFFPDKAKAFAEARRVLRPGGVFIFNVWDRIEDNEFADDRDDGARGAVSRPIRRASWPARRTATTTARPSRAISPPADSPRAPAIATVDGAQPGGLPRIPAIAYCQGTPLRNEIEARDAVPPGRGHRRRDGGDRPALRPGAIDGKIQAHVVAVEPR